MTPKLYKELQNEVKDAPKYATPAFKRVVLNYRDIVNGWESALMYQRRQNYLLKEGQIKDTVKTLDFGNYKAAVRAEEKFTRKQWFKLVIGYGEFYMKEKELRTFIKK